jgi:hypothetical protein
VIKKYRNNKTKKDKMNTIKKLSTSLLVTACFLISNISYGQTPAYQWAKNLITGANQCQSIGVDNSGNVYITGRFVNTVDFDPGTGTVNLSSLGSNDIYIAKYNASGNYVWAKAIGGSTGDDFAYKILVEANGDFLICGTYTGTVDFDPNAGITNLSSLGAKDGYFAKYDNNGNLIWAKKVGGTTGDEILSMVTDLSSNIYLTGYFNGTADFDPGTGTQNLTSSGGSNVFCAKYDPSGNYIWAFNVGGTGSIGNDIALDHSNNIIIGGVTSGSGDFDPGAGTATLTGKMFYAKYNNNGEFILGRAMGTDVNDKCKAVESDDQNNIYIAGEFNSTIDYDPGVSTYTFTSIYNDLFIAKYDSLNNFIYAFPILSGNSDYLFDIYVNSTNGDTYLSTEIGSTTDMDPGSGTTNINASYHAVFAKYDQYGNFGWAFPIGIGYGSNEDKGFGILENNGSVYLCGSFLGGDADFNPGSGVVNLNSGSNNSSFFGKYSDCTGVPNTPDLISGNTSVCQGSVNYYSIAAVAGATSYTWSLPSGWSGTSTSTSISATAGTTGGNITVTANNECGSSASQTLTVTVNSAPGQPGMISGNTDVCSGSAVTYSIAPVNGATSYTWSVPSGWTGTSTSASISATAGTTGGNITVIANNTCGVSASQTLAVTVNNAPGQPGIITGNTDVCSGNEVTYSITPVSGATSYTWSVPSGWTGTSTSASISATAGTTGGNITVTANNDCGSSTSQSLTVTVNSAPAQPGIITGNTDVCSGSAVIYSVTPVSGATSYTWSMPSGWTGTSTSASISATAGTTGGNITVIANNSCGSSTSQTLGVTVNPSYTNNVSASICQGDTYTFPDGTTATSATVHTSHLSTFHSCDSIITTTLTINSLPVVTLDFSSIDTVCQNLGIINLTGESPTGGIFSGTSVTGNTFDTSIGQGTYTITYTYSDANSCTNSATGTIYVDSCSEQSIHDLQSLTFEIYPNPTSGQFTISLPTDNAEITVINIAGQEIIKTTATQMATNLKLDNNGVYIVYVSTKQGTTAKKLVVTH